MAKDTNIYMFLTGLGVGALGAILLAPAAGSETRGMVLAAANDAGDRIKDGWAKGGEYVGDVQAKVKGAVNDGLARGSDLVDGVQTQVNDAVNATADASKKAKDSVVNESREYAHSAGQELENAGKRLQNV